MAMDLIEQEPRLEFLPGAEEEAEFERLYAAPAEIVALLSIFYGGISIVAVIGNTLVIWVVATTRQMRTVTNMYIANLAFADVIIGLFCIPFQFQAALLQSWNLPWFMCSFCPFVQALSVNVSVFTLTAIAIDRHRAIINPLRARPTKFISKFIIGGIWMLALLFAVPFAIAFRVEELTERFRENNDTFNVTRPFCMNKNLSDDQLQSFRYTLVFVQYLVPFCVISFVYIQMAVRLWGTRAPGNAQDSRDITLLKNKKKVIKMLIIVVVIFGLCWLPLQLYNILYVTIPEINDYHFISIVWFCCDWLAMSNSCYNPFIYGIYNEKFKREFNKRFAACFCKFQTSLDAHERTFSMHTRASSIRSTYANSSMRIRSNLFGPARGGLNNGKMGLHMPRVHGSGNGSTTNSGIYNGSGGQNNNVHGHHHHQQQHQSVVTFAAGPDVSGPGGVVSMPPWRRNNFKPLHPNVIECEDDMALMELPSTTPPSEEMASGGGGVQLALLSRENSSCICEQEFGSQTECDGTCILSEVSRVHLPVGSQAKEKETPGKSLWQPL
ncbi:RYamide receptor [Drosophila eugracilis]|uniref:RYamide receptor n=1 Tax=Drosophila eugracilis TaxID=29029 RepID=UPI0007E7E01B|nr:RYamide receptor [Drosophila eugracilis]XP_017070650.1 RYamide receptor [Drosophila eugracilis]